MSLSPGLLIPSMYCISSVWRHGNESISWPPHSNMYCISSVWRPWNESISWPPRSQYVPYKFCVEAME